MDQQKALDWQIVFDRQWNKNGRRAEDGFVYRAICTSIAEGHNGTLIKEITPEAKEYLLSKGFSIEEELDGKKRCWIVSWQQEVII